MVFAIVWQKRALAVGAVLAATTLPVAGAAAVPLGRGPSPEEIAAAVLFLAQADSVTGQTLAVDGGQHLAWKTPDVDLTE